MHGTLRNLKHRLLAAARSTTKKRVLIAGWLGAFNLGDEIMLGVTLDLFRTLHPSYELALLVQRKNLNTRLRYLGYKTALRPGISDQEIEILARECDALFVNGGALLDSNEYNNKYIGRNGRESNSLAKDLHRIASRFHANRKAVVFYGVSSNKTISDPMFISDYRDIVRFSKHFSVRDDLSRDEISRAFGGTAVDIVDDVAFADPILRCAPNRDCEGVGLIPVLNEDTVHVVEKILTSVLMTNPRGGIKLIVFLDEKQKELAIARSIAKRLDPSGKKIREILSPKSSIQLREVLSSIRTVVSMRYHGTLFSGMLKKETICVNFDQHPHYHNKNHCLLKKYHLVSHMIDLSSISGSPNFDIGPAINMSFDRHSVRTEHIIERAGKQLENVILSI